MNRPRQKPTKLVVLGAGGHAKVVVEILRELEGVELVGCTSAAPVGGEVGGIRVVGDDSVLGELLASGVTHAFVAVGDNRLRRELSAAIVSMRFKLGTAVSSGAIVSPRVVIGKGAAIMPGAVVNVDTRIGDGAIINTGATVDHDCSIAPFVHIAPGANVGGSVSVGEGAFLGIGCQVVPGVKIGAWSTVGAGGVVIDDLPEGVTAVGVPVRPIRRARKEST